MDHLSEVLSEAFHDSEIARNFACKRTKAAHLIYDVMGPVFKENLLTDLRSCSLDVPRFSVIIDESTDVSTSKILALTAMFYSNTSSMVKTKFLTTVELEGETAEIIFNTLVAELNNINLNIENVLGFAADTTNVIFGQNNSIVSRIKAANPNCVFVKCVCHSVALAVSYACKELPRNIEQAVKDVYGHFSHSSKRQREFAEFQEFVQCEKHNILRHYEIRWLSLHQCVKRIIEQWGALKLYFRDQYTLDRNVTNEFLCKNFDDEITKLYFLFLDYVLPIVNKFNVIFQANSCVVHRLHRDMTDMYKNLLSCYMKNFYIRSSSIAEIDPKSSVNFLDIHDIYLGVNVSSEINKLRIDKGKITDFLKRCQCFLKELCVQLKNRLPVEQSFFSELKFLDPQLAVYSEFSTLLPLMERFPNICSSESYQIIDEEYRQLKLDGDVQNLMSSPSTSGGTINVEKFWGDIHKLRNIDNNVKFDSLAKFAKMMMSLPVSNASCERVFSQVNLVKTDLRNKLKTENVSSLLHVKQGLSELGNCTKFKPDSDMIRKA